MIGLAIIICSVTLTEAFIKKRQHDRFNQLSNEIEHVIIDRYKLYENFLRAGLGLFETSEYVDSLEWKKFVESQNIQETFPGLGGIGFIEHLTTAQLNEFNNKKTIEQRKKFQNHPPTTFNDKFVITYIEPFQGNEQAVGLDIGFEKNRRNAAEKSIKTRQPTLTNKIELVQDNKSRAGFLLLMPFFDKTNKQLTAGSMHHS
jgi:CHASE1-domain containing sensor protein